MDFSSSTIERIERDKVDILLDTGDIGEVDRLEACLAWKAIERTIQARIEMIRGELETPENSRKLANTNDAGSIGANYKSDEYIRAEIYTLRYILLVKESLREEKDDE